MALQRRKRRDLATLYRYTYKLVREFRGTIFALALVIVIGALAHRITPMSQLQGTAPPWSLSFFGAWMALFAQPLFSPPETWYLEIVVAVYPLLGVLLIGEGMVHFALLMLSRRRGEKEWMLVMASTYRNHVVLCGLGHLGFRVLGQLLDQGRDVVVIEKDADGRFLEPARATGVPVLVRDMKDDDALIQAGVAHAQSIIITTEHDMANLEVALDAKRMNPKIRVALRMFDPAMARKLQNAFAFDFAFSQSALAAPTVAAMALECRVVSAFDVAGRLHVVAELEVAPGSSYDGISVAELEQATQLRVLGVAGADRPAGSARVRAGQPLIVDSTVEELQRILPAFGPITPDAARS